ncbi:MAG: class II fructose-bisphosphatase [Rhodospirillales bacterium]|nr:class II fructose-bisphosphatase [Rhodospirillales bacterium]
MSDDIAPDRNLALEAVRATEAAAIAAARFLGGGDERAADQAAVSAMHRAIGKFQVDGTVRIGEGDAGDGKLFVGQKVGTGTGPKADVALVAIEGTSIVARGGYNALSVLAMAEEGGFLTVPEIYMDKIAVGPEVAPEAIELDKSPGENLNAVAECMGVAVSDLQVCLLDRPRHGQLVAAIRETGARIQLIMDGDVNGAVAPGLANSPVDVYMGIGGAPQGVLAAAALRALGGGMQGRLVIRSADDGAKARDAGIEDPDKKLTLEDMAGGHVTLAATGITQGPMLNGVRLAPEGAVTHSMVMRSRTGTFRYIEGHHDFRRSRKD